MDYQHYQQQQSAAADISNSYHHFRLTSPFPPPSALALKIKFLQANISRHAHRGIRVLQSIKDVALYKRTIRGIVRFTVRLARGTNSKKSKATNRKAVVNSIMTVHVMNYSSSLHILAPVVGDQAYYNADWSSVIPTEEATPLSGYLEWLEDRSAANDRTVNDGYDDDDEKDDGSDINRRAESFIARCYEKFKLEKQESYRRYQEMMARSL